MEKEKLIPPDFKQCQTDIYESPSAQNFLQMGGQIGGTKRCTNKPMWVVRENRKPNGEMSLCESCRPICEKEMKKKKVGVTFRLIRKRPVNHLRVGGTHGFDEETT